LLTLAESTRAPRSSNATDGQEGNEAALPQVKCAALGGGSRSTASRDALLLRGEGPHQLSQKRSLALVSILQSLGAAEIANTLYLRDFRIAAILEFFNTIGAKRTFDEAVRSEKRQRTNPLPREGLAARSGDYVCRSNSLNERR
jgi:hypothetical protein